MTQPLLATKYRPKTIDEFFRGTCRQGQKDVVELLLRMDDLNLLFIGNTCSGKTTLLTILIREYYQLGPDAPLPDNNLLYINNLKEQGISFFRTEMKTFCQASSTIFGKKKMVIIDDIDTINEQSQQVFRNYIDKYKHNIHFIAVCTNIQKVIESFQSRVHILRIDPPNQDTWEAIYNTIVQNEGLVVDEASKQSLFTHCTSTVRSMLNQLEKIRILGRPITLDVCTQLCTDISLQQFEHYVAHLRSGHLNAAIQIMYNIYDYGYSVVDIYDYFFSFVKTTETLTEDEKYRIIPVLCKYITIFHSTHESSVELAFFTNSCLKILFSGDKVT